MENIERVKTEEHPQARLRFTFEAGAFLRGKVVSELKNAAFNRHLSIQIEEDKGLFDSNYRVVVEGDSSVIKEFQYNLNKFFNNIA